MVQHIDCVPGHENDAASSRGECVECPSGTFGVGGARACEPCEGDTYASEGSSACTKCPSSSYANEEHTACIEYTSADRAAADFNHALVRQIHREIELELTRPWSTLDYDAEMIESGNALKEDLTTLDPDAIMEFLFAGIGTVGSNVWAHGIGSADGGRLWYFCKYHFVTRGEGFVSRRDCAAVSACPPPPAPLAPRRQ